MVLKLSGQSQRHLKISASLNLLCASFKGSFWSGGYSLLIHARIHKNGRLAINKIDLSYFISVLRIQLLNYFYLNVNDIVNCRGAARVNFLFEGLIKRSARAKESHSLSI